MSLHDQEFDCEDPTRSTFSIPKNEVNSHYHFLGGADRYWVQPAALLREEGRGFTKKLIPVKSDDEKEIAKEFARYFHEETGFDFPPYSPSETRPSGEEVFLIPSDSFTNSSYDFIVGAVGTEKVSDDVTAVMWIWIHPFARGSDRSSLALRTWKELEEMFGEIAVLSPITKPMRHFLEKNRPNTRRVTMSY
jgi:hypothetical protein